MAGPRADWSQKECALSSNSDTQLHYAEYHERNTA